MEKGIDFYWDIATQFNIQGHIVSKNDISHIHLLFKEFFGARDLRMCKIKTNSYLEKLKEVYANNWQDFWE